MSALLKEILLDLAVNKIVNHDEDRLIRSGHSVAWEYLPGWEQQCETACDIQLGIEQLYKTGQVDKTDILLLAAFLAGMSTAELATVCSNVKERLIKLLALLEDQTQYTDERYLHSVVRKYPKFEKTKEAYAQRLFEAGRNFE